jgi:NAD(P)-dependent dehydrogenase (short-subunit alcohol dehydrogenase family)
MRNVIIITGASSGFGSLASHALARAGYIVYAGISLSSSSPFLVLKWALNQCSR